MKKNPQNQLTTKSYKKHHKGNDVVVIFLSHIFFLLNSLKGVIQYAFNYNNGSTWSYIIPVTVY